MNRIIYNNCYGGYGFSELAAQWFKEKLSLDIPYGDSFVYSVKNHMIENYPRHHQIYKDCALALGNGNEDEGLERMSGQYAALEFCDIGDEDYYYVTNYDGLEEVITTKDLTIIEDEDEEHYVLHAKSYNGINFSQSTLLWMSQYILRNIKEFEDKIPSDSRFYFTETFLDNYFPRHHKAYKECIRDFGGGDEEKGMECFGNNFVLEKITDKEYYIMEDDGMEYLIFKKWFTKISCH